ncbi:kelch repeat-containing protein [Myxococcota bacterium]
MAYHAVRGVIVLFGGALSRRDTWEYDGVTWVRRVDSVVPRSRYDHAMSYNAQRGSVIMYGGRTELEGSSYPVTDAWEFDGNTWSEFAAPPAGVSRACMAYDAGRGVMVLHGRGSGGTWEYEAAIPHARTATHAVVFPLLHASPDTILTSHIGDGVGDDGTGDVCFGVEVLLWDWTNKVSVSVGSYGVTGGLLPVSPPPPLSNYVNRGRIWLLATPMYPSSEPGGAGINSEIHTDYVELQVTYTIP